MKLRLASKRSVECLSSTFILHRVPLGNTLFLYHLTDYLQFVLSSMKNGHSILRVREKYFLLNNFLNQNPVSANVLSPRFHSGDLAKQHKVPIK